MQSKRSVAEPRQDPPEAGCSLGKARSDFRAAYAEHFDFVWRTVRLLGVPAPPGATEPPLAP